MDIVLAKDYPSLGFVGDKVQVRNGYARNFLIPNGIAVESSSRNARQLEHRLDGIRATKRRLKAEAEEQAANLRNLDLSIKLKVGRGGKSFGSISTRDIESLLKEKGLDISRKQILLSDPIKSVGEFPVAIKLHSELNGEVLVKVIAEHVSEKHEPADTGASNESAETKMDEVEDSLFPEDEAEQEDVVAENE